MRKESWRRMAAGTGALLALVLGWQAMKPVKTQASGTPGARADAPTVAEARTFTETAQNRLLPLWIKASRAQWVQETYITDDTEKIAADADQEVKAVTAELADQARRFDGMALPDDVARKLKLLKLSVDVPAPRDPAEQAELAQINASLQSDYGRGKWCPDGPKGKCLELGDMERIMAESRDPMELLRVWEGWHAVGAPMRGRYSRMVVLANKGARDLGFADVGAMWRSNYDMPPDKFAAEVDRLWQQVRPLYEALHAYTRTQLVKKYGAAVLTEDQPIPAHLLGNMWGQEWNNIYPMVEPPNASPGYSLTKILQSRNTTPLDMVHYGERFFMSLGFAPLPQTFWERSLFVKPADREVVCHASAWDVDFQDDLRIKMCIEIKDEDFATIHHELGHNFYQRAYKAQPPLFADSANDGFHEAIGDTIALSVTPEYLKQIGLLEQVPPASSDLGLLMTRALGKVAFLPFGLMVDQWRWKVFSGEVTPANYNQAWWDLRLKYEGIAPPVKRTESDFDPGAKYHVPANVPYTRYFLATILQFQFHRALCRSIGYQGPLHRCSIYNNKAAGARLERMLSMGKSKPWPDALEAMTGERQMDATAILDYFAPLKKWLDDQNDGHKVGW
jgi:peptidyl-dipeptidase A